MPQLTLAFPHKPDYSAAAWQPTAGTAAAVTALKLHTPTATKSSPVVALYGAPASGKTHLLSLWLSQNPTGHTADDLQNLAESAQITLFHLFNRLKTEGGALVVASTQPIASLNLLPDLKSRLLTGPQLELQPPNDTELLELLNKWASDRQLFLPPNVTDYLLTHAERSAASLHYAIQALDTLSLEAKRGITIPMVKKLLQPELPLA